MVGWQGPGGVMMQMSAQEFISICAAASAWVRIAGVQAAEVAAAHSASLQGMIPTPVCTTNRTTYAGLAASNLLGQNTPIMIGLDIQYGGFWVTNATQRAAYGAVATSALAAIGNPPPLAPAASDPAGAAAAVAQDAAGQGAAQGLQQGAQTMTGVADAPLGGASSAGSMGSLFSSAAEPLTSMGQTLPSMAGQGPSMAMGLLGPLTSSLNGMNGASAASLGPGALGSGGLPGALGGAGSLAGGGGGMLSGPASAASSFVRPASSFSSPNAPTLPGGWSSSSDKESGQVRTVGSGGGGLYGAPPSALGHQSGSAESEKSSRTLQVTARPGASRGEKSRI
jgi:PPE-repeat protein